jgi:hypothetical protein
MSYNPPVWLPPEELAAMTPAERQAQARFVQNHVFGFDHRTDRSGRPIEQGLGSPSNPGEQHFAALERAEGAAAANLARQRAAKAGR